MDDIARHLGISKKTLYQHVRDKKELVLKCVKTKISDNQCAINKQSTTIEGNAIDKLMAINKEVGMQLSRLHPSVLYDLQRYYSDSFQVIDEHKKGFIRNMMLQNLKAGMAEGLYRDNINPELVAEIYVNMVDTMIHNARVNMPEYSLSEFHKELIRYHIRGIASPKGIDYLVTKFNKSEI